MNIVKKQDNEKLIIMLEGRLDTNSSPELEKELKECTDGISLLEMDLEKLEYMSSAGLRVFLATQKKMKSQGKMVVRNVNEQIMEIFEITGFVDILDIE